MTKRNSDKAGERLTDTGARVIVNALGGARKNIAKVPGPSTNPATNLLIADIAMRSSSRLFRRTMEKGFLRLKFPPERAHEIVEGRSLAQTVISTVVARVATRSVPGALLVGGALLGKVVVDRSMGRRRSSREGRKELEKQAENAD